MMIVYSGKEKNKYSSYEFLVNVKTTAAIQDTVCSRDWTGSRTGIGKMARFSIKNFVEIMARPARFCHTNHGTRISKWRDQ